MVLDTRITTTLGDCAQFVSGGTPSKAEPAYWHGDIPWVSAKDMKSFYLDDAEDHVTTIGVQHGTRLATPETTLLLVRGMTLHKDVPICVVRRTMAFNQDVKALVARDGVHPRFLAYWLVGNKHRLLSSVDSAGHGTGRLNTDTLKSLPLELPSEEEQRAIADAITAIDDKIELNRRMNETLEAMARAIFKSWFVDFDPVRAKAEGHQPAGMDAATGALFPSAFEDSPLGKIPKGWTVGTIADLVMIQRDSLNPLDYPDESFEHYSIPAFDAGRVPAVESGATIKSSKFQVSKHCVLLSKLNPRIPRVWIPLTNTSRRAVCSTEFIVCTPTDVSSVQYLYGFFTSGDFRTEFSGLVTGTSGSHQRVKPESFVKMAAVIPPSGCIEVFSKLMAPMSDMICHSLEQSLVLADTRDTLLPKLMSGEIRLTDAEKTVGAAI